MDCQRNVLLAALLREKSKAEKGVHSVLLSVFKIRGKYVPMYMTVSEERLWKSNQGTANNDRLWE